MVSWLAVLLGTLLSVFIVAIIGGTHVGLNDLAAIAAVILLGFAPLFAALVSVRNPMKAARIDLRVALLTPLAVAMIGREFGGLLRAIAVFSGAIVIPGLFWFFASRHNWPVLLPSVRSPRQNVLSGFLVGGLFCILGLIAIFGSFMLPWWNPGGCGGRPLFDERGNPYFMDFTARIVFVGPNILPDSVIRSSLWSVARVEERFSENHSWLPKLIVLRGVFDRSDENQRYFVEGRHSRYAIARFLPVIEPVPCGHTARIENAIVAMRILRDGPPKDGVRLIGSVSRWGNPMPVVGATVFIEGPLGKLMAVTDAQGNYDKTGLPPGHYTVAVAPNTATEVVDLKAGGIGEYAFFIR
jgi:hypothetical protein